MKRIGSVFLIACAMLLTLLTIPANAFVDERPVVIHSGTNSSMCLDVSAFRMDDGAPILHFDCNGAPNQVFHLRYVERLNLLDRYGNVTATYEVYNIVSNWSNKCIDVLGERTNSGAQLLQKGCNDRKSQQWLVRNSASLNVPTVFVNGNTIYGLFDNPRCMDVPGATTGRAVMQIWSCNSETGSQRAFGLPMFVLVRSSPGWCRLVRYALAGIV
ncbi:RICIN domain-containing protein, partial [Nonomuraea sp. NPDC002799]